MKTDNHARLIRAIQTCRRKVEGLDEDTTWRDFLQTHGGGRSLSAMSGPAMGRVLDALHKAGAPTKAAAPAPRYRDTDQSRMIRGRWIELADMGVVRDRSEVAMSAFVKRQTAQDIGLLSPENAAKVIEALKAMKARAVR